MSRRRLEERLRKAPVPEQGEAEERGWRIVRAAFAQRPAPRPSRRPYRLVVALAAGILVLAVGLSPAGARVGDWIGDLVDPGVKDAEPALTSLPTPGQLLVTSAQGTWTVQQDGSKRLLGVYDEASWSPEGLYVIAARGRELTAVDPLGEVRWSLGQDQAVSNPTWAPSGFRIAYLSGTSLRIVAGDGSGDHVLRNQVAAVAPAWKPASRAELAESPTGIGTHLLAFVDPRGRITVADADSGRTAWRSPTNTAPTQIHWSANGRRLLALSGSELRVFDARIGRALGRIEAPLAARFVSAAVAPTRERYALVESLSATRRGPLSEIRIREAGAKLDRQLFSGPGEFSEAAWSPDGEWLLFGWKSADQWLFFPTAPATGRSRVVAVDDISRQFDPGGDEPGEFPQLEGWCCAR